MATQRPTLNDQLRDIFGSTLEYLQDAVDALEEAEQKAFEVVSDFVVTNTDESLSEARRRLRKKHGDDMPDLSDQEVIETEEFQLIEQSLHDQGHEEVVEPIRQALDRAIELRDFAQELDEGIQNGTYTAASFSDDDRRELFTRLTDLEKGFSTRMMKALERSRSAEDAVPKMREAEEAYLQDVPTMLRQALARPITDPIDSYLADQLYALGLWTIDSQRDFLFDANSERAHAHVQSFRRWIEAHLPGGLTYVELQMLIGEDLEITQALDPLNEEDQTMCFRFSNENDPVWLCIGEGLADALLFLAPSQLALGRAPVQVSLVHRRLHEPIDDGALGDPPRLRQRTKPFVGADGERQSLGRSLALIIANVGAADPWARGHVLQVGLHVGAPLWGENYYASTVGLDEPCFRHGGGPFGGSHHRAPLVVGAHERALAGVVDRQSGRRLHRVRT